MPASCRRLRQLSTSAMRDGRILLQRDANIGWISTSSGCNSSTSNAPANATARRDFSSSIADRWHQRRSGSTREYSVANSSSSAALSRSTSLGATGSLAGFHSSPLSWFSADAEEAKPSEEETTTAAETSSEGESSPDEASSDEERSATDIVYDFAPPEPLSQASKDKVQAIFDKVLWLDMIEVHLLTQIVNEQMGISWRETEQRKLGGGAVVKKAAAGGGAEEEAAEEKTIFDLKLVGFDAKAKIKVIKEVRNIAGLGLKEAKELVEGAPKVIQKELKQEKADELKAQLEAIGAQVELV